MERFELVVLGGGLASARAIQSYREAGRGGRVALVSADAAVPYHRPPLSKRYLRGEQEAPDTYVHPEAFYREHDVELLLETRATALRPSERELELVGGRGIAYERLLVATGGTPRPLPVPGGERAFTLRTLADSTRIREAARSARRAVVVGAGFIGMEVTASLRRLGVEVALVHRGGTLFEALAAPRISERYAERFRREGVELVLHDQVATVDDSAVRTQGGRELPCDLIVAGLGIAPAVELLAAAGAALENGVVVDARYETTVPGVHAAGDIAFFHDPLFGRRRRIEHWSNANYQGTEVGKVLAGADGGYDTVSSFFSEVFGLVVRVFGDTSAADQVVYRGPVEEEKALALFLEQGRLAGAVSLGQDEDVEAVLRKLIGRCAEVLQPEALADPGTALEEAVGDTSQ